jgi:uncharacterized protein YcbK (DUF882 family)
MNVKKLMYFLSVFIVVLITLKLIFLYPANEKVKLKLLLIESEVSRMGYKTNWIVISEKRHKWYNSLLMNSAKNSIHLSGDAIDIYVFDVDGDNKFTYKDVKIIEKACRNVEREFPELIGGFGSYMKKGFFSKNMVHIDTRGYYKRWY